MELKQYLSAELLAEWGLRAYNCMTALMERLDKSAIAEARDFFLQISQIDWKINPADIRGIFNNIEQHLYGIDFEVANDFEVSWINPHSKIPHTFAKKNGRLFPYVKRWFDWLDYTSKTINGELPMISTVYTLGETRPEHLFDINNNPILTNEGYFKGGNN